MDTLLSFIELIVDVWKTSSFGIGMEKMLVAFLIFLSFAFVRGLFSRFVLQRISRMAAGTETQIDDLLIVSLERPLKFFFLIIGLFFAVEYLQLGGLSAVIAEKLLKSFVAVGLFWFFYAAVTPLSYTLHNLENILSKEIVNWLVTVARWGVILTGLATVLQIWGIQIGPIIAGFGLFGVAVALGAQDLFKNLISGILVLVEKRFRMGDWIRVDGIIEGVVEKIGFRSTVIRKFDKSLAIIPNFQFAENAVINVSQTTNWLISWIITLQYDTTVDQLKTIRNQIEEHINKSEDFDQSIGVAVRVDKFADSSIDMYVRCFSKTNSWNEWLKVKENLALSIKQIVETNKASFAFPSQSIYVEKK